jgi:hypothetical protein
MNIKTEVERSLTKLLLSTVFCRNGAEEKVIPAHFACAAFVKHVPNRERKINGTEWGDGLVQAPSTMGGSETGSGCSFWRARIHRNCAFG